MSRFHAFILVALAVAGAPIIQTAPHLPTGSQGTDLRLTLSEGTSMADVRS